MIRCRIIPSFLLVEDSRDDNLKLWCSAREGEEVFDYAWSSGFSSSAPGALTASRVASIPDKFVRMY